MGMVPISIIWGRGPQIGDPKIGGPQNRRFPYSHDTGPLLSLQGNFGIFMQKSPRPTGAFLLHSVLSVLLGNERTGMNEWMGKYMCGSPV